MHLIAKSVECSLFLSMYILKRIWPTLQFDLSAFVTTVDVSVFFFFFWRGGGVAPVVSTIFWHRSFITIIIDIYYQGSGVNDSVNDLSEGEELEVNSDGPPVRAKRESPANAVFAAILQGLPNGWTRNN